GGFAEASGKRGRNMRVLFVAVMLLICAAAPAAVVLDGTLGSKGSLGGPNYLIDAGKGRRFGSNLFHSFSTFDLASGETATFGSHIPVKNVLARVTGGSASNIDGTIRCTVPNASFYLINPAGVVL